MVARWSLVLVTLGFSAGCARYEGHRAIRLRQDGDEWGYGSSVTAVPDMDYDGLPEVAVGGPGAIDAEKRTAPQGEVGLYFSSSLNGRATYPDITLTGRSSPGGAVLGDGIGGSLVGADLDSDGVGDLVMQALEATESGEIFTPGAVVLVMGSALTSGVDTDISELPILARPQGQDGQSDFILTGSALAFASDATGGTLVVGNEGSAPVYVNSSETLRAGLRDLTSSDLIISSMEGSDLFGASVALADVDGSGILDVIVGAPSSRGDSQDESVQAGVAYLFHDPVVSGSLSAADADLVLVGGRQAMGPAVPGTGWESFAFDLSPLGDLDGDGLPDVAISEPFHTDEFGGAAFVFFGAELTTGRVPSSAANSTIITEPNVPTGALGAPGDFDGDGLPELSVVAGADQILIFSGALIAKGGTLSSSDSISDWSDPKCLPTALAGADFDGDGFSDLLEGRIPKKHAECASLVIFGE